MTDHLFDEKELKSAVKKACEYDYNFIMAETSNGKFNYYYSNDFLVKMDCLVKKSYKLKKKKVNYFIIAAVIIALNVTTVLAYEPIRTKFYNFIMTIFNDHVEIIEEENANVSEITTEITTFKKLSPAYIPDGFNLEEETISTNSFSYFAFYADKNDNLIDYVQVLASGTVMHLTSDGKTKEEIKIGSLNGYFITDQEINSVVFKREGYIISISSQLEKDILIKIAESIKF